MKQERLTPWQMENAPNEYRRKRALLDNAITDLNRYLRQVSYRLSVNQATPALLALLQAEFELTDEDELKLHLEFKEVPAEKVHVAFLQWWDRLGFALKNTEPSVPEDIQLEVEMRIRRFYTEYIQFTY